MYRKFQIETIESSYIFLRYVVDPTATVTVQLINPATGLTEYTLSRTSMSTALKPDQFAVDDEMSAVIVSLALRGKTALIFYYTDGTRNPYYAASNLHQFITKVLSWTENRIVDGLFLYWESCESADDTGEVPPVLKIKEGSFVYDGTYYTYSGELWDIRKYAPPTVKGHYRAYRLFINREVLDSRLNKQYSALTQIGVIHSKLTYEDIGQAKLDVDSVYEELYSSEPIDIAYMYVLLTDNRKFNVWIRYPKEARTL